MKGLVRTSWGSEKVSVSGHTSRREKLLQKEKENEHKSLHVTVVPRAR